MSYSFPENPSLLTLMLGIFVSTAGFAFYYFLNRTSYRNRIFEGDEKENVKTVVLRRLSGITIYLIFPLIVYLLLTGKNLLYLYTGSFSFTSFHWFLPLAALLIFTNYIIAGKPANLAMYPEIRKKNWSLSLIFLSAVSWTVYLFAYEFLFRALLFIPALNLMGFWPAVILNSGIYTLVHIPKGIKESSGAFLFGFILCLLVVRTGSFWIAFFLHVVLALSNEWFSLSAHPGMKVVR